MGRVARRWAGEDAAWIIYQEKIDALAEKGSKGRLTPKKRANLTERIESSRGWRYGARHM